MKARWTTGCRAASANLKYRSTGSGRPSVNSTKGTSNARRFA
jgi:hypothetical protein